MRVSAAAILAGFAFLGAVGAVSAAEAGLPAGWFRAGTRPTEYDAGVDRKGGRAGTPCAFIRGHDDAQTTGFGTLMQSFDAADYAGKRVRLSAMVRAQGIRSWAGVWMRVDGAREPGSPMPRTLAFDNMQDRPITGTADWTRHEIVLDVPIEAREISLGILLSGPGQAWMDDLQLEVVGADVKPTGVRPLARKPNLRFED